MRPSGKKIQKSRKGKACVGSQVALCLIHDRKKRRGKEFAGRQKAEGEGKRAQLALQILASPVNENLLGGVTYKPVV